MTRRCNVANATPSQRRSVADQPATQWKSAMSSQRGRARQIGERHGERLGHDAADLDRWVVRDGGGRAVELHAEAGKPVDAYLSWWETVYWGLTMTSGLHTVAYGRHPTHGGAHLSIRWRMEEWARWQRHRLVGLAGWTRVCAALLPPAPTTSGSRRSPASSVSTKGGFYWHFEDRSALLHEVLDEWERLLLDEVIERVEAKGGDARARLRRLFAYGLRRRRAG